MVFIKHIQNNAAKYCFLVFTVIFLSCASLFFHIYYNPISPSFQVEVQVTTSCQEKRLVYTYYDGRLLSGSSQASLSNDLAALLYTSADKTFAHIHASFKQTHGKWARAPRDGATYNWFFVRTFSTEDIGLPIEVQNTSQIDCSAIEIKLLKALRDVVAE